MSLVFPPSNSNNPMYHRNDSQMTVKTILIYFIKCKHYVLCVYLKVTVYICGKFKTDYV